MGETTIVRDKPEEQGLDIVLGALSEKASDKAADKPVAPPLLPAPIVDLTPPRPPR